MKNREKLPSFLNNSKLRYFSVLLMIINLGLIGYLLSINLVIGSLFFGVFLLILMTDFFAKSYLIRDTNKYIQNLSNRIKKGQEEALIELPVGIVLYNNKDEVEWINPFMITHFSSELVGKNIKQLNGNFSEQSIDEQNKVIEIDEQYFKIVVNEQIKVIYLMDISEYISIKKQYKAEQIVLGNIFVDNYDEITQSLDDKSISSLNNFVTTRLSNWAEEYGVYLKRISTDRFLILLHHETLKKLETDKFNIIDVIREATSKRNIPLTISMGIAYGEKNLNDLSNLAQSNLDLALARGGDQVIVKAKSEATRFYGGKSNPMEKRTRVRSRMISQALVEIMNQSDKLFIMGHKNPDMDAIGSAMGIRRIAEMNNKEAWIILDPEHISYDVSRLLKELEDYPKIKEHFITPAEAEDKFTENSTLILVDHHQSSISIDSNLVDTAKKLVIIDHHRRGDEFPKNPILVYMEPYASSTAELVAELFEYQTNNENPIIKIEATAMLAGIIVDTRSFSLRTGTRTFDAASYLRSCGADAVMIQRLLKENVDNYLERSHLIEHLEMISDHMAVTAGEEEQIYDSVTTAQTADTMLSMSNIEASFVVTRQTKDTVGISARSLGEINVQVIMEKLGGGGHLSNAATQIKNESIEEVKERLLTVIKEF